jgi:guanylate kinase
MTRVPDLWLSISATTRAPRPGETEGVHYYFLSSEEFHKRIDEGSLLEWAEVHGNRYGTPADVVRAMISEGRQVVLEIDPQGAQQVKRAMPEAVLVFIKPPDFVELRRRLEGRASETPEQIETRMATAIREMELAGMYDFVVTNDDVARATDELVRIIDSYAEPANQTEARD